ncbi:MAG: hypothetical protein AAFZ18_39540, partial [Myxococcota bacterium]
MKVPSARTVVQMSFSLVMEVEKVFREVVRGRLRRPETLHPEVRGRSLPEGLLHLLGDRESIEATLAQPDQLRLRFVMVRSSALDVGPETLCLLLEANSIDGFSDETAVEAADPIEPVLLRGAGALAGATHARHVQGSGGLARSHR